MEKVFDDVKQFTIKYSKIWLDIDCHSIPFKKTYSLNEKKHRQKEIDESITNLFHLLNTMPKDPNQEALWQSKLKNLIKDEATKNLKINNPSLEKILFDGFMDVTEKFIKNARNFDNSFKMMDIMQAMRNVWIMNLIQVIASIEIEYTNSIFAYSMLYPYTDNFLDNPNIQNSEKKSFNIRLKSRLQGDSVAPLNHHEEKIYCLIDMIEMQYDRKRFPQVFESIISIQNGQIKSLSQQSGESYLNDKDILLVSAEKGGASVLADACLVCVDLDEKLSDLMFGFGFILQLIDDLQDVKEDMRNNHITIFSQTAKRAKLDSVTNKLISFTLNALDFENNSDSPYIKEVRDLIMDNCILMIFEAISKNKRFYTKEYLKKVEKYSTISFKWFLKTNRKIRKKVKSLNNKFTYNS